MKRDTTKKNRPVVLHNKLGRNAAVGGGVAVENKAHAKVSGVLWSFLFSM